MKSIDDISNTVHWVDGECRIRPEVRAEWDAENRRRHPHMTEAQILASWGVLEVTFGVTIGPPEPAPEPPPPPPPAPADEVQARFGRWRHAMRAGEAMVAALEAGDGPLALAHLAEARRVDPVVAELHVQAARNRRLL